MAVQAAFMVPHPPLIVPEIGRGGEEQLRETSAAYEQAAREVAALKPEEIVLTSPHSLIYADYFHISPGDGAKGSFRQFRAGQVRFEEAYDTRLRDAICRLADAEDFPAGTLGERDPSLDHGTMVPLWFIRRHYAGGKILRIGLSGLPLSDHYRLGQLIARAAEETGRNVVFVASGDLSHKLQPDGPYGFAPEGPLYDEKLLDACGRAAFGELLDFDETFCEKAAECGHRSFVIMAGALDGLRVRAKVLSHQDVTGVGYGIGTFYPEGKDESRHFLRAWLEKQERELAEKTAGSDAYVKLARASVESWVLNRRVLPVPEDLPEELLKRRAGAFVSIHKNGQLRGCIGTISPVEKDLAREIIQNAVSASSRDPRFSPISAKELKYLEISVDVLGEPEPIDSLRQLNVKRYGVIVTRGRKRGLLLPDLDGVDTAEEQVRIAKRKAGIREDESCSLERFEVVRHY